tara:strand:+ start:318 stop:503 length:186 start_codon:yes stop_codon:yes gene_type:complete
MATDFRSHEIAAKKSAGVVELIYQKSTTTNMIIEKCRVPYNGSTYTTHTCKYHDSVRIKWL